MRLIDADALGIGKCNEEVFEETAYARGFNSAIKIIENVPTIDAVPVVRCKDCIHHTDEEPGMVYCPAVIGGWVSNDFFCGDGEREEY